MKLETWNLKLETEKRMKGKVKYDEEKGSQVNDMNEDMIAKEIEDIEREIAATNLDASVAEMVEDWNVRKRENVKSPELEEIRSFVAGSADTGTGETGTKTLYQVCSSCRSCNRRRSFCRQNASSFL